MHKYLVPLAAAAVMVGASSAFAAQTSANFQARVTIQTSCVVTASALDFGNVGVINGSESTTSSVGVNCSAGTPYTLSFDPVTDQVSTYNSAMTNSTNGEDVAYSASISGVGGTGPGSFTITGTLPAQTTPSPAQYTDNKVIYLNY
jgi:spore coat protein U-like protein